MRIITLDELQSILNELKELFETSNRNYELELGKIHQDIDIKVMHPANVPVINKYDLMLGFGLLIYTSFSLKSEEACEQLKRFKKMSTFSLFTDFKKKQQMCFALNCENDVLKAAHILHEMFTTVFEYTPETEIETEINDLGEVETGPTSFLN